MCCIASSVLGVIVGSVLCVSCKRLGEGITIGLVLFSGMGGMTGISGCSGMGVRPI